MPPWSSTGSDRSGAYVNRSLRPPTRLNSRIDLLRLQVLDRSRYPYLLQSVSQGSAQTRYDILCAFPQETVALTTLDKGAPDFLAILDRLTAERNSVPAQASDLPFIGGWFVYLGYELAQQIEPVLSLPVTLRTEFPIAFAAHTPVALINDHVRQCGFIVTQPGWEPLAQLVLLDIERSLQLSITDQELPRGRLQEDAPEKYLQDTARILQYIYNGDVFQVNLSREWRLDFASALIPELVYRHLCRHNPAPFAASIHYQDSTILSSSPERLFKVVDSGIETRPIAGTRPRHARQEEDRAYLTELLAHPKERAEHIMLIDLERNDLGRICIPGSVHVNELMTLESHAHVHHIVSDIRGRLREDVTPGQIIRALFPGGTITGCPKVRCMQIIAELEQAPRGPYTGAVGYISAHGNMDFNILIRSLTLHGGQIKFRTGAGIVADSDPQRELAETRAKARGLLLALGVTP